MELKEVVAALRAAWWLPVVGLVLGCLGALLVSALQTPLYTSSTQLFISTRDASSTSTAFQGSQFSQQRVASYAQLIGGEALATRVIDRLDLDMTPAELRGEVQAVPVTDTVLINVTVTDPISARAQRIAQAVGQEFADLAEDLETSAPGVASPVKVTVTDEPNEAVSPTSPRPVRNIAMGGVLGLLIGGGVAALRARLDRTVKDADMASELTSAPTIGLLRLESTSGARHVVDRSVGGLAAEEYRHLRNNLQFLNVDEPPRVLMISSAVPSEGKTTVAVNLGLVLAEAGRKVTVVEADLRRPRIARDLGLVGDVGLTNVLAGSAELEDVSQRYGEDSAQLTVVPAGPLPPNPGELLASAHMHAFLEKARNDNDFVLVDVPPLLPVADSSGLVAHTDGVLLVVAYGSTGIEELRQAATMLDRVGGRVLGVILNSVPPKAGLATVHRYGYSYSAESKVDDS